jgi:hypothetical protein
MSTTRSPPIDEWKGLEEEYLNNGMSHYQAHRLIASLYNVHPLTVYLQLTPAALAKRRDYERARRQDPKRREQHRAWNAAYRSKPEVIENIRSYQRKYKQVYRHISEFFPYLDRHTQSPEPITAAINEIYERTGIRMRPQTAEKALARGDLSKVNNL